MAVSQKIIRQCKKGDAKAQEYIYNEYSSVLYSICLRYMKNRTKADDVLQDAFVIIFTKIKQYKNKGSFEGWVKRITVNTALMQLRKDKKDGFTEFVENLKKEEKKESLELDINNKKSVIENAKFSQTEIFETIQELPEGFRTVFNLYVIDELKHKEIAKELNISVGTSKSQLMRARNKIEKILYKKGLKKLKEKNNFNGEWD